METIEHVAVPPSSNPTAGDPAPATKSASYIPGLDGIRGIAFLLVFMAHSGLEKFVPGGFGVTVFFFLSGFLITTLLRKESRKHEISLPNFYMRRARRILPPMYITLVLGYVLNHFHILENHDKVTWGNFFGVIFYYYNYFNIIHHNTALPAGLGTYWSLMIEEHFYLLFPLLYKAMLSRGASQKRQSWTLAAICGVPFVWRFFIPFVMHLPMSYNWTYNSTDARFDAILWGCVLAIAGNPLFETDWQWAFLRRHRESLAVLGLIVIVGTIGFRNEYFRETARYTLQSLALYPIFFYCVQKRGGFISRFLEWRPLREIGHLSYAMYLIHWLILLALPRYVPLGMVGNAVAGFALSVLYAVAMRSLVENPLRRLVH